MASNSSSLLNYFVDCDAYQKKKSVVDWSV